MEKWEFDPNVEYQRDAINAVLDLFEGQDKIKDTNTNRYYKNELTISRDRIAANLMKIQKNPVNDVGYWDDELYPDNKFTIEMETGTGKTYVYLRTILELYTKYGFSKFILIVPSIPIRMGVEKSIKQLREHFMKLYNGLEITHCCFVYDSKKVAGKISDFTQMGGLKIMITTDASINKDTNILRNDKKETGRIYWEELEKTHPIVIIDEPQKSMGTHKKPSKAAKAIKELNPIATLMYSATHTDYYNLIYRLDSFKAFKKHLVKSIRVSTVFSDINKNYPYFRYIKFNNDLTATAEVLIDTDIGIKTTQINIQGPCDLYKITGLDQYKGFKILNSPHRVKGINTNFTTEVINGQNAFQEGESNYNPYEEDMVKIQMRITIKKHLDKQLEMLDENVKVLSLFFIDEVIKYRDYDKENAMGTYATMFEQLYNEIIKSDKKYSKLLEKMPWLENARNVHQGYFAIDKNKKDVVDAKFYAEDKNKEIKITEENREEIQRGIEKILNGKERLIQLDEPISFIFAHSALSEGWDNPNVFQLCFLRQTKSEIRKKQEIGRGLRLARGSGKDSGIKKDENINQLLVIANENYEEFAKSLQQEFNKDNKYNKDAITIDDAKLIQITIESSIGRNLSNDFFKKLHDELVDEGFIKQKDYIIDKKKIKKLVEYDFRNEELNLNKDRIILALQKVMEEKESKTIEKYLINDDKVLKNIWYKHAEEPIFQEMLSEFKQTLSKKTVYKISYEEQDLILNIIDSANRVIKHDNREVIEKTGILNGEDRQKGVRIKEEVGKAKIHKFEETIPITKSFVDIINYIANKTNFTREAIMKIITQLENPILLQRQDNEDKLIKIIENEKKNQFCESMDDIEYSLIEEKRNLNLNSIFFVNEVLENKVGKSVFETTEANKKALCKYIPTDSTGEYKFAEALEESPNVLMYAKIKKGSFMIETPIENYSPDWAIVYKNEKGKVKYFVIETKWDKTRNDLSDVEKLKIKCAKEHFKVLNGKLEYDWVNSWEDFKEKAER